ncbi:YjeF N-terminal domain-containing protein [Gorgonomyces haynaldii]|nr:YjeF N-terminal domain-containing protein [Gorgonomyces haynaldii]
MDKFLGLNVEITLSNGIQVNGTVSDLDPKTQQLSLRDCVLSIHGMKQQLSRYTVQGTEIQDLHVIEPVKMKRQDSVESPSANEAKISKKNQDTFSDRDNTQDFDFEEQLSKFDKKKVFAEIKKNDQTDPQTLLVNINKKPTDKIPHNVNVLQESTDWDVDESEREDVIERIAVSQMQQQFQTEASITEPMRDGNVHFETITGSYCPTVTPLEMAEIERTCVNETGPNEEQMLENGGRGLAMLVMQAIGGETRIKPLTNQLKPEIVILCGNNKAGAYGVVAGRHLANHGCNVTIVIPFSDKELNNLLAFQLKIFYATEAPHPELIIDALCGTQSLLDLPKESDRYAISALIKWTGSLPSPIVSVDVPSGCHPLTGVSAPLCVRPRFTVSMGLLKSAHLRSDCTGTLFLCDIGLPASVFNLPTSLMKASSPFGDKYLVRVTKTIK